MSITLSAAGFDCREVPAQRSSAQRRSRRLDKTDAQDAVSAARALAAEPTLGPVQAKEVFSDVLAKIEAVLEHRRILVHIRTLTLQSLNDQITKLPTEIRDQLTTNGKIEGRLRRLEQLDPAIIPLTSAGRYRLKWIVESIDADRNIRRQIRRLERDIDALLDPTARRYAVNQASGRLPQQLFSSKLATHTASQPKQSSRVGAAPVPSRSRPAKVRDDRSVTASISVAIVE